MKELAYLAAAAGIVTILLCSTVAGRSNKNAEYKAVREKIAHNKQGLSELQREFDKLLFSK